VVLVVYCNTCETTSRSQHGSCYWDLPSQSDGTTSPAYTEAGGRPSSACGQSKRMQAYPRQHVSSAYIAMFARHTKDSHISSGLSHCRNDVGYWTLYLSYL